VRLLFHERRCAPEALLGAKFATYGVVVYNTGALTAVGSTATRKTAFFSKYDDLFNAGTVSESSSTIGNKKYH
jgi:hypothetical protein